MQSTALAALATLTLAGLLGGCGTDEVGEAAASETADSPQEVVVHARDYAFVAPDSILSGPTVFRLVNEGPELHHVQLVRLEEGHGVDELMQHLATQHAPPSWMVEVGGPNTPVPGGESNAVLDLEPGSYAMLCFIPSPDGKPHLMKGMVRPLKVLPRADAPAMPAADIVMTLDDYSFTTDRPIPAGTHTLRVENRAAQPHEVVVVQLAPGRTLHDMLAWAREMQGPPPGKPIGGTTGIAAGGINLITLDFAPGDYALLCFAPDAKDGRAHIEHGMARQFRVG